MEGPGEEQIRTALLEAAAGRWLVGGESPDQIEEAALRIAELLATLEEPTRSRLLAEAVVKISTAESSLRKLEKKIRQASIATVSEDRLREASAIAPDIIIDDLQGTVRFSMREEQPFEIAGEQYTVPVVARAVGGELERALLTSPIEEFVAQARAHLSAELEDARRESQQAADKINEILAARLHRHLYDVRSLKRVVNRALRTGELSTALEHIIYDIKPLDREAEERERMRTLIEENDLIAYREYFPRARELKRELIFYAGPTNSGKTWRALNDLVEGESGVYLAPLRLLALEGQEEIRKRGKDASYLTGEERDIRAGATFIASTIEMLDTRRVVDAAVIDEVQLLTDDSRGWAWCQALVGVPARRVLMTGSPDAIPLVRELARYLDEPLTVHTLDRHTPIEAEPHPISLADVEPGTAIIAFSRRDVLELKQELESRFTVAVIYGNLTPEVRREEARRFREGEAQVLVSTDAIAMGLNLPIRTVVFSTIDKWNGTEDVQLEPWEILQIGGRAGRFGHHERGHVRALRRGDAKRIAQVFSPGYSPPPRPLLTRVQPGPDHIEVIAEALHTYRLSRVLEAFQRGMSFDSELLTPGVHEDMITLANITDRYRDLPLTERLTLASSPVDTRNDWLIEAYAEWMAHHASGGAVTLDPLRSGFFKEQAFHDNELKAAEFEAKRLTLYAWLAFRFPETFPDLEECTAQRVELDRFIERSLATKRRKTPRSYDRRSPRRARKRRHG